MKLTAQVKLQPTPEQHELLKATLEEASAACNWISERAFDEKVFKQFDIHRLVYKDVRASFNLSSQMAVRAIGKVSDAYKVSKKKQRGFKKHGAFPYDSRILSFKIDSREVSIWTIGGRQKMPFLCSDRAFELLQGKRGEADLCFIRGEFYLFVSCEIEAPEPIDVEDALGVDLGLANVATDSDGNRYSGAHVISIRERRFRQRRRLQAKGTRSARRVLKRLSGREQRFMTNVNHTISKRLVERAQRTNRIVALEDLTGIRDRVRARRSQRRKLHSWAFHQLGQFVQYKAELAGVPVVFVDPAYTSQTCSDCGHVSRSNRKSQDSFLCVQCSFSANADVNAAVNISVLGWAARNSATRIEPLAQVQSSPF
jgi:putative transposase